MLYFIIGFVACISAFTCIATARAGWSLKDLPLSYRWDLVGWAWLDLQLTLTVCYLIYINRMDLVFPALIISLVATFKLPSVRRRVIAEGAAVAAARSKPEEASR